MRIDRGIIHGIEVWTVRVEGAVQLPRNEYIRRAEALGIDGSPKDERSVVARLTRDIAWWNANAK